MREVRGDSSAGRLPPAATLRGELDPPTVGNEGRWGVVPPVGPVPLKGFPPCRPGRLAAPEVLRLRSGRRGAAGHRGGERVVVSTRSTIGDGEGDGDVHVNVNVNDAGRRDSCL